jgi:hypothetical protein
MDKLVRLSLLMVAGLALAASACGSALAEKEAALGLDVVKADGGYLVTEAGKKVLFYRRDAVKFAGGVTSGLDEYAAQTLNEMLGEFDKTSRPHYVHPLWGLDGEVLTEDFPFDHLHHHGAFWAWHQVYAGDKSMGDGWEMMYFYWDVSNVEVLRRDGKRAALRATVLWKSPNFKDSSGLDKPFIKEVSTIRVYPAEGDIRRIDFEISLLALEKGVRIGGADNEKGYGGFSVRLRFPDGAKKGGLDFVGTDGEVKPKNTPVEAGPWLDFSGKLRDDGGRSGVAILCHKSIPGYPRPWILRSKESMQNAVFPGREPVALPTDEPLVLRYRLIVHRGDITKQELDKLQAEYNAE